MKLKIYCDVMENNKSVTLPPAGKSRRVPTLSLLLGWEIGKAFFLLLRIRVHSSN